jgi:hypothetical protein
MIEICNMHNHKPKYRYDVAVCRRRSILGNPFILEKEADRDKVCDQYEQWFEEQKFTFFPELQRLLKIYREFGKLRLFCWCTPKRCHAETIRRVLLEMNENLEE